MSTIWYQALNYIKDCRILNHFLKDSSSKGLEPIFRSKVASTKIIERRFAVEAAAASIYSTANFVATTEDVSCF
jgi:hypothetical protein